jgi:hypothetical protein
MTKDMDVYTSTLSLHTSVATGIIHRSAVHLSSNSAAFQQDTKFACLLIAAFQQDTKFTCLISAAFQQATKFTCLLISAKRLPIGSDINKRMHT